MLDMTQSPMRTFAEATLSLGYALAADDRDEAFIADREAVALDAFRRLQTAEEDARA